MKEIKTQIEINASASTVWKVLIKNEEYSLWNPFIIDSKGEIIAGKTITNEIKNGSSTFRFKPKIELCIQNQKLEWFGRMAIPKLFDGRHTFELIRLSETKTLLIHREQFSGILVSLLFDKIAANTKNGFILMNEALKKRCENEYQTNPNCTS